MQTDSQSSSLAAYILQALAMILAGGVGSLLTSLFNRRKITPEIDGIEAKAALDRAQARRLDSEIIDRTYERIDELTEIIGDLRVENARLQGIEAESKIVVAWNSRMKAVLEREGLKVPTKWEVLDS